MDMDEKWQGRMKTAMGVLAIPTACVLAYGLYFVFTYKAPPKPPEPKIDMFRADGKPKGAADAKDPKKKPEAKKSDEPQVWDVELVWEVENAAEITIDQGIGKVEAKGSKHVEIDKNTTFVMKAKNATGEVTYNLDVEVLPAQQ